MPVLKLSVVASRYARSWLLLDILSSLPYPFFLDSLAADWLWLLRLPRTARGPGATPVEASSIV